MRLVIAVVVISSVRNIRTVGLVGWPAGENELLVKLYFYDITRTGVAVFRHSR